MHTHAHHARTHYTHSLCGAIARAQVGRAKEKAEEAERKAKRAAAERFVAFMADAQGLRPDTGWDEFEGAFAEEEEFVAVSRLPARAARLPPHLFAGLPPHGKVAAA